MTLTRQSPRSPSRASRSALAERLRARRAEIEEAILLRADGVAGPAGTEDPAYLQGLREAVLAGVGYGLTSIERGQEHSGPVPVALLTQARQAARYRVGLDVVLRRYAAGYSVLGDFLMQETTGERDPLPAAALYHLQRELTALFDRLLTIASIEYEREAAHAAPSQRFAERVRRLLAGELIDTTALDYDLDAHHLAAIAIGPAAERTLRDLATDLDRRPLIVAGSEQTVWAWFGGRAPLDPDQLARLTPTSIPPRHVLALGEPSEGLSGWRLSHRQAQAALAVALRDARPLARYSAVALLAAVARDEDLSAFLLDAYLQPLAAERDGGETLRCTLLAYFAADRSVSSAAAALDVTRHTVTNRLRVVEQRLGCSLNTHATEIELALRLAEASTLIPPRE